MISNLRGEGVPGSSTAIRWPGTIPGITVTISCFVCMLGSRRAGAELRAAPWVGSTRRLMRDSITARTSRSTRLSHLSRRVRSAERW